MKDLKGRRIIKRVNFGVQKLKVKTEKGLFEELNDEFGFTLNPCCKNEITKCNRWFVDEEGLEDDWGKEIVYLCPPTKNIARWIEYAMKGEIRLVKGRLKFGGSSNSATFPSMIVIFRPPGNDGKMVA